MDEISENMAYLCQIDALKSELFQWQVTWRSMELAVIDAFIDTPFWLLHIYIIHASLLSEQAQSAELPSSRFGKRWADDSDSSLEMLLLWNMEDLRGAAL
jgi:hypothetical protein